MRFRISDGYTLQRTVRRTYPCVLWTDSDLTFQDDLGWPVDMPGEKRDGDFLPETPGEATRRRIDSVLRFLDDWDDWITELGGDEDEDGREDLARIRRMKCHLRRTLKGLELLRWSRPRTVFRSACGSQKSRKVRGAAIGAVAALFPAARPSLATNPNGRRRNAQSHRFYERTAVPIHHGFMRLRQ